MAVEREGNWLGQQRVDVQHLRLLESAARYDFDVLAGAVMAGGRALVVSGFRPATTPTPIGQPATSIALLVAGSVLLHPLAAEAGTTHRVPADRAPEVLSASNPRVRGSFTPGTVNYVGIDLRRSADDSTSDLVQFVDADDGFREVAEDVPLSRTLDYVVVVGTQDFSTAPSVAPALKVTTDGSGNVTAVRDARPFAFRLASGGSVPDAGRFYSWPGGRAEVGDNSDFDAGDKAVGSLKDWIDAAMTRLWELGGGERWYSPTADRNVQMARSGTPFTGGEFFEWDGTNLHWKGLKFLFDNSTGHVNELNDQAVDSAGLTDLIDGECLYVDLDRFGDRTVGGADALSAAKASLVALGTPSTPGSRFVIAWRLGAEVYTRDQYFPVGTAFAVATNTALGVVKLGRASADPAAPTVFNPDVNGTLIVENPGNAFPNVTLLDTAAEVRDVHDRNGYPNSGLRTEIFVSWLRQIAAGAVAANLTDPPGWNFQILNVTASYGTVAPTANYPTIAMEVSTAGGAADGGMVWSDQWFHSGATFLSAVFEFDVEVSALVAGAQYYVGLCDSNLGPAANNAIFFQWKNSDPTEWQGVTVAGGVTTNVFTGVPPTTGGTHQALKIEILGSASHAGALTVNFWVNGALGAFAASTTNIPSTALSLFFGQRNGGAVNQKIRCGNVHAVWNNVLSLPAA